jgi:hypothetical protein
MSRSYHQNYSRISKTMLGHFAKSPADFARYYVYQTETPPSPKRQMVIGSAIHAILLERTPIEVAVKVYPASCLKSDGSLNGKPAASFREDNPEAFCMKEADALIVQSACDAVMEHELGELIDHPDAVFELPQEWTCPITGIDCRLMADFYIAFDDYVLAYDLKTTEDIYPAGVKRTAKTLKYWLQDAHYSSGLETIFGKPVKFRFLFLEINHPNRIAPWEYEPRSREICKSAYVRLMERLKACRDANYWPDEWTQQVNHFVVNPWEVDEATEDAEVEYVAED